MEKRNSQKWSIPNKIFGIFLFLIVILCIQMCYISLSKKIYGIDMKQFASNRNTVKQTLYASRGNIMDSNGNVLAQNITSYTVIAYLSETRTGSSEIPLHVVDKHATAVSLAPLLDMDVEYIEGLLNKDLYQVELGPGGRGITELKKDEIVSLGLPGIDFIENYKRYYPNGDFASYVVGYAKQYAEEEKDEDGNSYINYDMVGELGIESRYDEYLKGTNGYLEYQKDLKGFKIPDTKETRINAKNGYDIYLTIDSGIERFAEEAISDAFNTYNPEWIMIGVMDAKNGDILATSTRPSFDPNIKNIINYENLLISELYEPGSTMKTYTYMCAMEKGTYKGDEKYYSGSIKIGDDIVSDWNKKGWGYITYDKGFEYSSNVGISYMLRNFIDKNDLSDCLTKYGFGAKTGIELDRELMGDTSFRYEVEVANGGFGQGITTTGIQQMQGLTIIANNGKLIKPHIVDKIVDPNNGEIIYESQKEESDELVSIDTVNKMKELMHNVVYGTDPGTTGTAFRIDGFDIIAKTGTAQIYDNQNHGYLKGTYDYVYSFAGMYPGSDPKYIIYVAMKQPKWGGSKGIAEISKSLMQNIAKYKNVFGDEKTEQSKDIFQVDNYLNKSVDEVKNSINSGINIICLGDGNKVINQYPRVNSGLVANDKLFILTSYDDVKMPNIDGWAKKDVELLFDLIGVKYKLNGYGYVTSSNIGEGEIINKDGEIEVNFDAKIKVE